MIKAKFGDNTLLGMLLLDEKTACTWKYIVNTSTILSQAQ